MNAFRSILAAVCHVTVCAVILPIVGNCQWQPCGTGGPVQCAPSGNVGIGTTSPGAPLSVNGLAVIGTPGAAFTTGPNYGLIVSSSPGLTGIVGSISYGGQGGYQSMRADGTPSNPLPLSSGDWIGQVTFHGFNGGGFSGRRAGMLGWAAENWTSTGNGAYLTFETTAPGSSNELERVRIDPYGNVGIGTTDPCNNAASGSVPNCKLSVNGGIQAQAVVVNANWSDYVFDPNYRLAPLPEVADYIRANGHLPDVPSEAEVKQSGVSVGDMESRLLAKVEELTLHMIQADEENRRLRERVAKLEAGSASDPKIPAPEKGIAK